MKAITSTFWVRLFTAICILLATPTFAAPDRCTLCRQIMTGEYTVYRPQGGAPIKVCEDCQRNAPRCAMCNIPTDERANSQGTILCRHCAPNAHWCDLCQQLIKGQASEYRRQGAPSILICAQCIQTHQRCSHCQRPRNDADLTRLANGNLACSDCIAGAPVCNLCGQPVFGKFYRLEYQEGAWCAACFEGNPRCEACGAPMNAPGRELGDGRSICVTCSSESVVGSDALNNIANRTAAVLRREFVTPVNIPPIWPVDADKLAAVLKDSDKQFRDLPAGHKRTELGLYHVLGRKSRILVIDGLPAPLAWETTAHELAHAWQHQNYPQCTDPWLVEGFAQYVAEIVCMEAGQRRGLDRMRNRQDFYGDAYRAVVKLSNEKGKEGVLEALRTNSLR